MLTWFAAFASQAMAYGHNIFWGTRYLDHGGPFRVTCMSTGAAMQGSIDHSLFRRSTKQVHTCDHLPPCALRHTFITRLWYPLTFGLSRRTGRQ